MFVRIAWNSPAPATHPRSLRRISLLPRRSHDDLGVPAPDFAKMTKGLFDRQD